MPGMPLVWNTAITQTIVSLFLLLAPDSYKDISHPACGTRLLVADVIEPVHVSLLQRNTWSGSRLTGIVAPLLDIRWSPVVVGGGAAGIG
jgi:hypothetical protein